MDNGRGGFIRHGHENRGDGGDTQQRGHTSGGDGHSQGDPGLCHRHAAPAAVALLFLLMRADAIGRIIHLVVVVVVGTATTHGLLWM
jgi:hypothetical protein